MIVSNQEIHNVLDLAHTGPGRAHVAGILSAVGSTARFDAAPRVWGGLTGAEPPVTEAAERATTRGLPPVAVAPPPPVYRPRHPSPLPILPGQDRRWRHSRVHDLRRQLADGRYAVMPDIVADKIIGRALCDQVSRLYDR